MTDKYDEMAREMYSGLDFLEPFTHKARDEKSIHQIAAALRQVERETLDKAAKFMEQRAQEIEGARASLTASTIARIYRDEAHAIRSLDVSTANELSTTQELADVSIPVKLIDRDQSDGYVRETLELRKIVETRVRMMQKEIDLLNERAPGLSNIVRALESHRKALTVALRAMIQAAEKGE